MKKKKMYLIFLATIFGLLTITSLNIYQNKAYADEGSCLYAPGKLCKKGCIDFDLPDNKCNDESTEL